jgi:CBS domain containing-hemolysin-like protein
VLEEHAHLRAALNAMIASRSPLVGVVDEEKRYKGLVTQNMLNEEMQKSLSNESTSTDGQLLVTDADRTSGAGTGGE